MATPQRSVLARSRRRAAPAALLALAAGLLIAAAPAADWFAQPVARAERQPRRPAGLDLPELSPTVATRLAAPYLKPDEARALRAFHGQATDADLADPATRARVALIRGAFADPALSDPAADPLDRAEALLERGDPAACLAILNAPADAPITARAIRLRVETLEQLGRADEAQRAAAAIEPDLIRGRYTDAPSVVEAVRTVAALTRLRGPGGEPGSDHKALMSILGSVRTQMDPLYWPAILEEARLLLEKDNPEEAAQAIEQALSLCPASAQALALLGQMAVNSYSIPQADQIAAAIDALAAVRGVDAPAPDESADAPAPSPLGAAVRAKAMIRLGDADAVAQALAAALAATPARRELMELSIAGIALRFDDAATDRALADYDATVPGGPRALLAAGKALAEARQYDPAAALLRRAAERAPFWAVVAIEQGLLEMQSGRDEEALTALERAAKLDPFNVRAGNSLRLIREVIGYARVESEHFVVRAKPGIDVLLAREMLPALEENFRIVTGNSEGAIDHVPPRTLIDLMPDHQWFAVRIAGMPAIHTIAASTGPIIAMETPRDGPRHTGTYDWQRVVRHEYAHTVGLHRTNNRTPHWFTEAQAVYLEQAPRAWSTVQLLTNVLLNDALFDFTEINIAFTRPRKPTDRAQAYAQGHWMYQFMVETYGGRRVLELMDRFARGVREEQAFTETFGVGRERFMEDFKPWARSQLIAWGTLPPDGVPTVKELLTQLPAAQRPAPDADPAADAAAPPPVDDKAPAAPPTITGDMIDRWLAQHPAHPEVLELAVTRAIQQAGGDPSPDMIPLLRRYAAARPSDPMPHRHLARLALASATPGDAIEHLEYLDAREERVPTWAVQLATLYAQAGRWDLASAKVERATRIAPYVASHRELAATIALQRNDPRTAERHIEFLAALEPDREIHRQRLEAVRRMASP
ncbi:MAG: hypothetical protein KIT68_07240 [Phycisphaeraceae bacterium]|nr:hypothetical protein [Phycisphaeraceae bacterium]